MKQKSLSADCLLETQNLTQNSKPVNRVCVLQVKMILEKLYENKKIASATHNIYAYRSVRPKAP